MSAYLLLCNKLSQTFKNNSNLFNLWFCNLGRACWRRLLSVLGGITREAQLGARASLLRLPAMAGKLLLDVSWVAQLWLKESLVPLHVASPWAAWPTSWWESSRSKCPIGAGRSSVTFLASEAISSLPP